MFLQTWLHHFENEHANDLARSWECEIPIPDLLLEVLNRKFPNLCLGASITTLDKRVLFSPRLQRLAVSIPHSDCVQWSWLKNRLLDCQNLRALTIDAHLAFPGRTPPIAGKSGVVSGTDVKCDGSPATSSHDLTAVNEPSADRTQLPLKTEDRLPSLEELNIRTKTYDLDVRHCTLLLGCMDWTKLKRLTLGPSNPKPYFDAFRDQLPHLEALDFTYHYEYQSYRSGNYNTTLATCSEFVTSLSSLKELTIRCDGIDFKEKFWSALVQTHGDTLKSLSIQSRTATSEAPLVRGDMNPFLACFDSLENLDLVLQTHFPNSTGCKFCSAKSHGVVSIASTLLGLHSLQPEQHLPRCDPGLTIFKVASHFAPSQSLPFVALQHDCGTFSLRHPKDMDRL